MSKNSFTKNFNNCVAGLPIASVAAHMVLHEGLGKDLLKVGIPAAIAAGLYNYGGDMAQGISDWGAEHQGSTLGDFAKTAGDKLHGWHDAGTHWMQDSMLGRAAGLGGEDALKRQTIDDEYAAQLEASKAAMQQEINDAHKNIADPQARSAAIDEIKNKYATQAKQAGEYKWEERLRQQNAKSDTSALQKPQVGGSSTPQKTTPQTSPESGKPNPSVKLSDPNKTILAGATAGAVAGESLAPDEAKKHTSTSPTTDVNTSSESGAARESTSTRFTQPNPFGPYPMVASANNKNFSLVQPGLTQSSYQSSSTPSQPIQSDVPVTAGGRKVSETQLDPNAQVENKSEKNPESVPKPAQPPQPDAEKKLQYDFSRYNRYAQNIPSGAEFGLTAPESRPINIGQPSQQQQQNVKVGGNLFQTPSVQHRELVTPNIPAQTNTTPAQQPTGQASGGMLHQAEQQSGVAQNQPAQGMKLNANPEMTKNLIGRQSYSAGASSNLSDVQNPVFSGKKRQFLNGTDFNTQNQARPSPFGPRSNQNQKF